MKINYIEAPREISRKPTFTDIPAEQGFYFPAEWHPHEATWLSWPHNPATWPGKIEKVYPAYTKFIKLIAEGEKVRINVNNRLMAQNAADLIAETGADMDQITFYENPTNDAWCRDHGPAFLIDSARTKKMIVDWGYNAWGRKYPPFDLDDTIPIRIANELGLPFSKADIVMEGGSVDFNGRGTVLTTTSCLLNKNRNPHLNKVGIEKYLKNFYGVHSILWLEDGIVGDDTDGHIDDITRFVSEDTVVTAIEENPADENFEPLILNRELLEKYTIDEKPLTVIDLPMPSPIYHEGQRLPASYANFYIANKYVIVPTFSDSNDEKALEILQECFRDREVVGINSVDIIWGLGSFHCLSQQEPLI